MLRLIEFIRNISLLLLFLLIEGAAVLFYAKSDSYTQAKIFSATTYLSDILNSPFRQIESYTSLREKSEQLTDRVMELERELHNIKHTLSDSLLMAHSDANSQRVRYISAQVVRNSINRSKNYILLNRGHQSGIRERMAVTTPLGEIVGVVVGVTERYCVVMSILSSDFHSSGAIAKDPHVGALSWNGESRYVLQLTELSKYSNIYEGAEVLTTGLSQTFPRGLKIGRIKSYSYDDTEGAYSAEVELAADLSAIDRLIVVNQRELSEEEQIMDNFLKHGGIEELETDIEFDAEQLQPGGNEQQRSGSTATEGTEPTKIKRQEEGEEQEGEQKDEPSEITITNMILEGASTSDTADE